CWQRDSVSGDFPWIAGADPVLDQDSGLAQPGEELLLVRGGCGSGADLALETDTRRFLPAASLGFLGLGTGGACCGGAVTWCGDPEPVLFFDSPAGVADLVVVVGYPGPCAVLACQGRHDLDVVGCVPDRDPPDSVVFLAARGQAGAVHDLGCDVRPFVVAEQMVGGGGAGDAVPDGPAGRARAEDGQGLVEQAVEVPEVPAAAGAQRWFEFGGVPPAGHDV